MTGSGRCVSVAGISFAWFSILVCNAAPLAAQSPPAPTQPLRTQPEGSAVTSQPARLLPAGQTQMDLAAYLRERTPKLVAPTDAEEWKRRSEGLRRKVLDEVIFRGVPESWRVGEVKIAWQDTLDGDRYVIRKLRYEAVPGLWVGGLLYEPKGLDRPVPAVLCVNGHVGAPGMTIDYEQAKCINLAKRDMLAFHPEWIGMGQLAGAGYGHADLAYLDLCGVSGVSVFYQCLKRGLDVLIAHRWTDPERVAVTGLSGGGWQTIVISSLDTRVKLSAPNAGYIGLAERIAVHADIGDLEQNANDLVSVADYTWLTAMLAPRPALLIYNEKDDCCFAAERAKRSVYDPIRPVYELLGVPERFQFHNNHDPGTHNYLKDNRQAFYRFLNRNFLPREQWKDDDIAVENEIRKQEELKIEYAPHNANFHTLVAEMMKSRPKRERAADRESIRQIVRATLPPSRRGELIRERDAAGMLLSINPQYSKWYRILEIPGSAHADGSMPIIWHLPCVRYYPRGPAKRDIVLVADEGWKILDPLARNLVLEGASVVVVDLLFTGECKPDAGTWQWAQMVATTGERPLGIQVNQLERVVRSSGKSIDAHPRPGIRTHPAEIEAFIREHNVVHASRPAGSWQPPEVIAVGRVSGLAALTLAAIEPGLIQRLELRGMDASLKDLLTKKVGYGQAPSMFCFGLLDAADIPDLIRLAAPTEVVIR